MTIPLWKRPKEMGRRVAGNTIQYVSGAAATASAISIAIGNGETLTGKLNDALVLPDLLQAYRRASYVYEHQEEIQRAMEYLQQRAPTAEELQQMGTKAQQAVASAKTFSDHLAGIGSNLDLSNFHPTIAYDHLEKAAKLLPEMPNAYESISTASAKAAEVLSYLKNVDYKPAYSALLNFADNFANDERLLTSGLILGAAGTVFLAGSYIGSMWANRGIPGWYTRWKMNWGARHNSEFFIENPDVILGKDVYGKLEEHFRRKAEKTTAQDK